LQDIVAKLEKTSRQFSLLLPGFAVSPRRQIRLRHNCGVAAIKGAREKKSGLTAKVLFVHMQGRPKKKRKTNKNKRKI